MSLLPLVPLGEVLTLAPDRRAVDPREAYPNIGIYSFGRGVFAKPAIESATTSASTLYQVREGQFIYSRLFAFEGAYAVVPKEFDGYFVSNEFPTFHCDRSRVLPGYLRWLFRMPTVWREMASVSKGMGNRRKRVHPERILEYRAPLPSLSRQHQIVAKLDCAAEQMATLKSRSLTASSELRMAVRSAFNKIVVEAPRARMGDVAPLVRRPIEIDPDKIYTEIGVRSFYKGLFHRRKVTGAEFTWQKLFHIAEDDLVFSNLMAWEQAIALASAIDDGCVGNHRMLTCKADRTKCLPTYLWYYFTTPEGFAQVVAASPGTIARNKTLSAELLPNITVPIPSLDDQRWFESLHKKAATVGSDRTGLEQELNHLIPSLLQQTFG